MTHRRDELLLSIGGVVGYLELIGGQPTFIDQLRARYAVFEMPAAPWVVPDFALRLDLTTAVVPGTRVSAAVFEAEPLQVVTTARTISAKRWDLSFELTARKTRRGHGSFRGSGRCEMNPFSVDCILRVAYSSILPRVGGMLIHSCGLRHAEVSVVFPGASGAGKTTLARKTLDADDVLSDELVVVRRSDDGWRVHGTPFWGDFARGGASLRSWPLRTLAFLAQARRDVVTMTPIVSSDATLRLLGCFLAFTSDRATVQRNLALAARLCAEVRAVEASLTKNVPARQIFRKLAPHLGPEVTRKVPAPSAREMISELRSFLRKHRSYAFRPKGSVAGMRSWLKSGDSLLIQAAPLSELAAGDVLLYWTPGATPDEDALICQRMVAGKGDGMSKTDGLDTGPQSELLGRVVMARAGKTLPLPGRIGGMAQLFGSLIATPFLNMVKR